MGYPSFFLIVFGLGSFWLNVIEVWRIRQAGIQVYARHGQWRFGYPVVNGMSPYP
ncbi:hypothetical protein [Nitrosomonas communis]|uniref:hypothetical protein n=1 Tax=Nitrosomonas communis TaxID=44574 RepID=UPI0015A5BB6B|nr:hypothetical protein [Nitrosomonas communis]